MTKEQLAKWREHMDWTQKEARIALGMTDNAYRAMEKGAAGISRRTELACLALAIGAERWAKTPWLDH